MFFHLVYLKLLILKNRVLSLRYESRFKIAFVTFFILSYFIGTFLVLSFAIRYVAFRLGFGFFIIDRLLYSFLFILFVMLIMSQFILSYNSLFRNEENEYLMGLPVGAVHIFPLRFLENTYLSSWAFLFLSVPIYLSYGSVRGAGWQFYIWGAFWSVAFVIIACSIGTILALIVARFFNRRYIKVVLYCLIGICVVLVFLYRRPSEPASDQLSLIFERMFRYTTLAFSPVIPSFWMARLVITAPDGWNPEDLLYGLLLVLTALWVLWICVNMGSVWWDTIFFRREPGIQDKEKRRRRFVSKGLFPLLLEKELKLFIRDPSQWGQFLLFFGMIGVYILNIQKFRTEGDYVMWQYLSSLLNMITVILILGTLSTRFVYPQWTLESRKEWFLHSIPVSGSTILKAKLFFWMITSLVIAGGLIVLSDMMIGVNTLVWVYSTSVVLISALFLPYLSLMFGVLYPHPAGGDTARIVSGFGGTLTLTVVLAYVILISAITGFVFRRVFFLRGEPLWLEVFAGIWTIAGICMGSWYILSRSVWKRL